jgi:hypothetical protein
MGTKQKTKFIIMEYELLQTSYHRLCYFCNFCGMEPADSCHGNNNKSWACNRRHAGSGKDETGQTCVKPLTPNKLQHELWQHLIHITSTYIRLGLNKMCIMRIQLYCRQTSISNPASVPNNFTLFWTIVQYKCMTSAQLDIQDRMAKYI